MFIKQKFCGFFFCIFSFSLQIFFVFFSQQKLQQHTQRNMQRNLSKRSLVSAVFRNVQKRDKSTKSAKPVQPAEAPNYLKRKPFVNTKIDAISDPRKRSKIYYGRSQPQPDESPYNPVGQLKLGAAKVERAMNSDAEIEDKLNQHVRFIIT